MNTSCTKFSDVFIDNEEQSDIHNKLCCCCLELVSKKSIWLGYRWMDQVEVYGEMLKECFGINVTQNEKLNNQICEVCVTRLRNALCFRKQVVHCQEKLLKQTPRTESTSPKKCVEEVPNDCIEDDCSEDGDFLHSKPKRARIEKPLENSKRVKRDIKKPDDRHINYMKTRQNICLILENSTLLPFKSSRGYFNCFYCNKQHAAFKELKEHVSKDHKNVGFKDIAKCIIKLEVVKADASEILCKLCSQKSGSLKELVEHLIGNHRVTFNNEGKFKPENCILPYDLSEGRCKCTICGEEFLFFKTLSKHMNVHSSDNVCDVCGRCFLLPARLRAHRQMHTDNLPVKCPHCDKMCVSKINMKSHIRYSHRGAMYVCSICKENFRNYEQRLRHLEFSHGKTIDLSCKYCEKAFKSTVSLNAHVRGDHLNVTKTRSYPCEDCPMVFKTRSAVKCHSVVHSGEKNYECEICHKRYGRSKTLAEHLKIHKKDKRWSCKECGQAFVQKCSLQYHLRVHHGERDAASLMIYKKPDK